MSAPLLQLDDLSRRYGGVRAIENVSFDLPGGGITGVIGPNGAGKSTLFNLISGVVPPTSGRILFRGAPVEAGRPHRVARNGITRTFQNLRLFESLTVREHLTILGKDRDGAATNGAALFTVDDLMEFTGLSTVSERLAVKLPYGVQRRVEIARALSLRPELLLLDEPAAGMNPAETDGLRELIRHIAERGVTVLLIEHDMPFVMSLCEYLHVLNFGSLIASGSPADVSRRPEVLEAYLGQEDET